MVKKAANRQEEGSKPHPMEEYRVDPGEVEQYLADSHNPASTKELIRKELKDWKRVTKNNKKLSRHLAGLGKSKLKSVEKSCEHDQLLLLNQNQSNGNLLEPENKLEKTWKFRQDEIKSSTNLHSAVKSLSLNLTDPRSGIGGPFQFDYSRNGNFLGLIDEKIAKFSNVNLKTLELLLDISLQNEHLRCIKWLHNQSYLAIAQKRYVFIYDGHQGQELHQLRKHVEVTQMEFLPYHFLLATVGLPGWLRYHDTSTGEIVAQHHTKLGPCRTMTQNPFNAIIKLGHQKGTVTLWSPSVNQPLVQLLAHTGPVTSISVNPSSSGHVFSTTGLDGTLKVWDSRNWKCLTSWTLRKPAKTTSWSQKGLLAVGWGAHVSVYADVGKTGEKKGAYMTQAFPSQEVRQVQFCPFEDLLGVSHSSGFSQLIIPGAGEANFDSLEIDPFESKNRKKEREVHNLLDKIPFELINLDPNFVGSLANKPDHIHHEQFHSSKLSKETSIISKNPNLITPYRKLARIEKLKLDGFDPLEQQHQDANADDPEVEDQDQSKGQKAAPKERQKMRGRNSATNRFLRKKRKQNVITPQTEALQAKILQRRQQLDLQKKQQAASRKARAGSHVGAALSRFYS